MARDDAVRTENGSVGDGTRNASIGRRTYLKIAGVGLVGAAATATASADEDDVVAVVGAGSPASFEITADGPIEPASGTAAEASFVSGTTAEGAIEGDVAAFSVSGTPDVTILDGDATVLVNGDPVDPGEYALR